MTLIVEAELVLQPHHWLFGPCLELNVHSDCEVAPSDTREQEGSFAHFDLVHSESGVQVVCHALNVLGGQVLVVVEGDEHRPSMRVR